MIEKKEVKVFIERFLCKNCNVEMNKGDAALMSYPARYRYYCTKCNFTDTDYKDYPYITYEEK